MKNMYALKIAGIVAAGVAAYLIVTRTYKAGGNAVEAVKEVITKDLNPASTENVIYKNLPENVQTFVGDALGYVFDHENYVKYKATTSNGGHSNLQSQKITLAPTGAGGGQSSPEFAAKDPRRLDLPGITGTDLPTVDQLGNVIQ
jgi:tRNA A37 threonylcarbamoyladenosine dehydratase